VYKQDHKFDLLENPKGQIFSLRLYLDMMIHDLIGNHPEEARRFFDGIIASRYRGLEELFEDPNAKKDFCAGPVPGKIPTARHVVWYSSPTALAD